MKICYMADGFNSFRRGAKAYVDLIRSHPSLRDRHRLVRNAYTADVVIIQFIPSQLPGIYKAFPFLKTKYVIGRCVWETDDLPESYKSGIAHLQEIWTPSRYCQAIFDRYHPRVVYMPHVIDRDRECCDDDLVDVKRAIDHTTENTYYLSILKLWDPRKNAIALIDAFQRQSRHMPKARLVIKAAHDDKPLAVSDPRVIVLRRDMTAAQVNALYECCDICVSAHHSEGWGWTLSDALLFRKPTVATGYSGNLEFMNARNSVLLDYVEDYIRPEDVLGDHFTTKMKWAYPIQADLEDKLLALYRSGKELGAGATLEPPDLDRFRSAHMGHVVRNRLDEVERLRG